MSYSNPHFFVIVLAHVLKEQKLEIPNEFVRQHGMTAFSNNQTCLKVADGKEWNVGLTKCNEKVWFHHGWEKFVEFYSVGLDYFLVFKYEKQSSSFHVVIFDLTATEIDYPVTKNRRDEATEMVKMETSMDALDLSSYSQDYKVGEVRLNAIKWKKSGRKPRSTTSQRAIAMAKAASFQSLTLNPSFMCKIWPSNAPPGTYLNVPRSFSKMHVEESRGINLEVSDGRMWSVHCRVYWTPKMRRMSTRFRSGWNIFARENNLEVGDACVFEMLTKNSTTISFKVQIFRASSAN